MAKNVYTTEQTGKTWKGLQALGCLGLSTGAVFVFLGTTFSRDDAGETITHIVLSNLAIAGILVFLTGMGLNAAARLGAWWFHG